MKIPVHYYTEVTSDYSIGDELKNCYITNEGGTLYLVEILA